MRAKSCVTATWTFGHSAFPYSTTLRSLSQGRATYTMEFKHYTEAPKTVAEAVINKKT